MKSHLKSIAKKKVSDFLLREEGMVGNRSAFATAAFVSATSLAMFLVVSPDAKAGKWCGHGNPECDQTCCWDGVTWPHGRYHCVGGNIDGWDCW